jgi:serine/threonine protein kinase
LARKKRTGDLFALKVMPKAVLESKNLQNERDILAEVDNECIVKMFYCFKSMAWNHAPSCNFCSPSQPQDSVFIVMEYLPGGDLFSYLQSVGPLPEDTAAFYIAEIGKAHPWGSCQPTLSAALAIEKLHLQGIIHRDVKPDNVLVDKSGHIKLTDFGLSSLGLTHSYTFHLD